MSMFAPTASQMMRDDKRLRQLHRETVRRRKQQSAKQKQSENEEAKRREYALEQRRMLRNRHVSVLRKTNSHVSNQAQHRRTKKHQPRSAHRSKQKVSRCDSAAYIVPVCDQLPMSPDIQRTVKRRHPQRKRRVAVPNAVLKQRPHKPVGAVCEQKTDCDDLERSELDNFMDNAASDLQSIAELDDFDMKHFGMQQSIQIRNNKNSRKDREEPKQHSSIATQSTQSNNKRHIKDDFGYQRLFQKKTIQKSHKSHKSSELGDPLLSTGDVNESMTSVQQSMDLYSMNDMDMKSPEDNDSVKINPKDSLDCSKLSFSTIYNEHLLPLQSVVRKRAMLPTRKEEQLQSKHSVQSLRVEKQARCQSQMRNMPNHATTSSLHKYGIKLPRLTQSILKAKNKMDSRLLPHSPKSTYSAPVFNQVQAHDIGYKMLARRRQNTSTMIDDFFTKNSGEFVNSQRESHNTMFLPDINRSTLKPRLRANARPAQSVMEGYHRLPDEQQLAVEENKLKNSLLRINETLSNLNLKKAAAPATMQHISGKTKHKGRTGLKPRRNAVLTGQTRIPRKVRVKKSPTFKTNRRRGRWNI